MTVQDYLLRPELIRQEIRRKQERIESLHRYTTRLSAVLRDVRVKSTPDPAYVQAILAEIADEEQAILRLQEDLTRALADVALYISRLPAACVTLLEVRYLDGLTWPQVMDRLGYSRTSVYRIHRQALDLLPPPPEDAA